MTLNSPEMRQKVESVDEAPPLRYATIVGVVVLLLFTGSFGLWSVLAPLESAAIAPGKVSVDTNRKTVQHLEGGIVAEILARDGDEVEKGDLLIRLEDTQARASMDLLQGRLLAALAEEARLLAQRDGLDEIQTPKRLYALAEPVAIAAALRSERDIFAARRRARNGQLAILEQRILVLENEIVGLEGEILSDERQLGFIKDELEGVRELVAKGFATKPRLLALERENASIEGERSRNTAAVSRIHQRIGETKLQMEGLLKDIYNEVVTRLSDVEDEIADLDERILSARDVLYRTEIRSPITGTVVNSRIFTKAGVIRPGDPLMDLVPKNELLIIEAQVDPIDIDVVHAGLLSQVRLTALSQRNQLPISAIVRFVSADLIVEERTGRSYYLARVELTEDPARLTGGISLYPGMQAEVMILTGKLTPIEYLMRPISRSFRRAFRDS